MLNTLCWLYSRLQSDEVLVIRLPDEFECAVDKNCKVEKKGSTFVIHRPNGRTSVVNPSQVINARALKKEDWLL